jgi:secreted PhoX family phosphatase
MKLKATSLAVMSALGVGSLPATSFAAPTLQRVEFIGMEAPSTADEKASMYTDAKMKVYYRNGQSRTFDLKYHELMGTTDIIRGQVVGGLHDVNGAPLEDFDGQMASDAADGTSLMVIPGLRASDRLTNNALALVNQFEYKELPPNDGVSTGSFWSKLPATMSLSKLNQNKRSGALSVVNYTPIDFSRVDGGWIHCGSTLTAWNSHLSSEEYEPDAKVHEGLEKASDSDDYTDIASFSRYYFGDEAAANPYNYGVLPEVTVNNASTARVVKHYSNGRYAREMQIAAEDQRTLIGGDDGKFTGLFMFVADTPRNLTAGTLYAAKVTQTGTALAGSYDLDWIKLGHATDRQIERLVDGGIRFSDMFDVSLTDPGDPTYTKVTTYMGTEWLRLKPGQEQAAAFLETRRYAALKGATTEFNKMEYIAYNKGDNKFYMTISRIEKGMTDTVGDIQGIAQNMGGAVLEMATAANQRDTDGNRINSRFVGTRLSSIPELMGGALATADAEGNRCDQTHICGPDNIVYSDEIQTLFIGEDTGYRNNNYVWAYNIRTKKLSRILSTPMYAEATGLMVAPNYFGHAYIMSNFQHPGDGDAYTGADAAEVMAAIDAKWNDRKKAALGYIGTEQGALPAFK